MRTLYGLGAVGKKEVGENRKLPALGMHLQAAAPFETRLARFLPAMRILLASLQAKEYNPPVYGFANRRRSCCLGCLYMNELP
jgi:hypothetical protein